jgi:hypothetical protein
MYDAPTRIVAHVPCINFQQMDRLSYNLVGVEEKSPLRAKIDIHKEINKRYPNSYPQAYEVDEIWKTSMVPGNGNAEN